MTQIIKPERYIDLPEIGAPATPGAGRVRLYGKIDGLVYGKDDAGTETALSGVGGGGSAGSWELRGAPAAVVPVVSGVTSYQISGGATLTDLSNSQGIRIFNPASGSVAFKGFKQSLPAGEWRATIGVHFDALQNNYAAVHLAVRRNGGAEDGRMMGLGLHHEDAGVRNVACQRFTDTAYATLHGSVINNWGENIIWMQLQRDASGVIFFRHAKEYDTWRVRHSENWTSYFPSAEPNELVVFTNSQNLADVWATCFYLWLEDL